MSKSFDEILGRLQGIDRYNPQNIPILEEYVQYEIENKKYNLDANLALLKLYQFNPNHFQTLITAHILLKALTNLPHADFVLCKCLIDNAKFDEEGLLRKIIDLSDLLERCQFREFWLLLRKEDKNYNDVVSSVNGFQDAIIEFILHIVSKTYQTIAYNELVEMLGGLAKEDMIKLISARNWRLLEDDYVSVANHEESIKTKNIVEKIKFSDVSSLMTSALRKYNL